MGGEGWGGEGKGEGGEREGTEAGELAPKHKNLTPPMFVCIHACMSIMIAGVSLDGANEYRLKNFALARPSLTM
jgi:hypothetical protein